MTVVTGNTGAAGTVTLGTVPAGKAWRIYAVQISGYVNGTQELSTNTAEVQANSVTICKIWFGVRLSSSVQGSDNASDSVAFAPNYVSVADGQTVTFVTTAVSGTFGDASCSVFYEEITV